MTTNPGFLCLTPLAATEISSQQPISVPVGVDLHLPDDDTLTLPGGFG